MAKAVVELRTKDAEGTSVSSKVLRVEVRASDREPRAAFVRVPLRQRSGGRIDPLDDDAWIPGAPLEIDLEPPGGDLTPLFRGTISHVRPHFEDVEGNSYLELLATDVAGLMDRGDRSVVHEGDTESALVKAVLEAYGLTVDIADFGASYRENRIQLVQRSTDWQFVSQIAERHGLTCFVDLEDGEPVARVRRRSELGGDQPDLVVLQRRSNLRWFDAELRVPGPLTWTGLVLDPFTAETVAPTKPEEPEARGSDELLDTLSRKLAEAGAPSTEGWLHGVLPQGQSLDDRRTGADEAASWVLEGRGEIDGALYRGLLRPGAPVLVRGVGRRLTGAWYVESVRTIVIKRALTQTFVARRNNTGTDGSEAFDQRAETRGPR